MILVYSNDIGLINFRLKELFNDDYFSYTYDNNMDEIEKYISQCSLFNNNKNLLIRNLFFLKNKTFTDEEKNFLNLLKRCDFNIIITIYNDFVQEKVKPYFKQLIEIKKLNKHTIKIFIDNYLTLNKLKLNENLISYLCKKLPMDGQWIISELDKLIAYNSKDINVSLIDNLIISNIEENVFKLVDYYFLNEYENIIKLLNFFEKENDSFLEIFSIFINRLFMLKLYLLHFNKYKNIDILLREFNISYFQIDIWEKLFLKLSINNINLIIDNLIKLNKDFLEGNVILNNSFKLFLIKGWQNDK